MASIFLDPLQPKGSTFTAGVTLIFVFLLHLHLLFFSFCIIRTNERQAHQSGSWTQSEYDYPSYLPRLESAQDHDKDYDIFSSVLQHLRRPPRLLSNETMASPDLLAAAFADLTLGLPLSTLQLEGGDVIVRLSERRDDVLLLHSKVLGAASERFQARFGSRFWEPTREVPDKTTGETVRVYEYRLIHADQTFVLSDEVCIDPLRARRVFS